MALTGAHAPGATPLSEEDLRGLKLASIGIQRELNEAEAQNIIRGQDWALRSRTSTLSAMLDDKYLLRLHTKMFGDVQLEPQFFHGCLGPLQDVFGHGARHESLVL